MAAFFSRMFRMGQVVVDHPVEHGSRHQGCGRQHGPAASAHQGVVKPALLDNSPLKLTPDGNPRKELARWMTSHPYFAEAAVNRIWGHFFARGIVDPVDDFRSTNPPTHPELLAALAADFREHGYDLRRLMKTIVSSRTYQLSHRANATNREDVTNYSRSLARGLDAEVLLDAVADVTGIPETFSTAMTDGATVGQAPAGTRAIQLRDPDTFFSRFLELYGRSNRGAIPERNNKPNLSQAMHVLAGATYVDRLSQPEQPSGEAAAIAAPPTSRFSTSSIWPRSAVRPPPDELQELKTHSGATRRPRSRAARVCLGLDQLPRIRGESLRRTDAHIQFHAAEVFSPPARSAFSASPCARRSRPRPTPVLRTTAKAKAVILFWLEGGPSHIDTWDPKTNSNFKPISTNVPASRSPSCCRRWRSAWTSSRWCAPCTPAARIIRRPRTTPSPGHEINPAMQFPSLGSIVTKELGPRNAVPAHVLVPKWDRTRQYEEYFRAAFLGGDYDPMCIPDPAEAGLRGDRPESAEDAFRRPRSRAARRS